jgi:hypothetical protein
MELGITDRRQQGFIRTANDAGPAKQRKRFTATSRYLTGTMTLTKGQRDTFETFYSTTLGEGAGEFTMNDPLDKSTKTFRFMEPPEMQLINAAGPTGHWKVSLSLELLP